MNNQWFKAACFGKVFFIFACLLLLQGFSSPLYSDEEFLIPEEIVLLDEQADEGQNVSCFELPDIEVKKHKKHKKNKKDPANEYQWQLSIAAVFQEEAPYLKEWIEYYKLIGVHHFYLYNNFSTDHYQEVLAPYIKRGEVDLIDWPYKATCLSDWDKFQVAAYRDAIQLAKGKTKWLALIDLDEFIVPVVDDNLARFLNNGCGDDNVGGVCLIWSFFGTSNVQKIPEGKLLIETLVLNTGPAAGGNVGGIWNQGAYKSIIRPEFVTAINSAHYCAYVKGRSHTMLSFDLIHINHYWTRDEDYLHNVKIPRRKTWGQESDSVLAWAAGMNGPKGNNPILRFVKPLRMRMELSP